MMRSPPCSSSITHDWVEQVLQQHEQQTSPGILLNLTSFTVVMATKPGESFNAELVKVDACAELRRTSVSSKDLAEGKTDSVTQGNADSIVEGKTEPEIKEYSFIAKFLSQDTFNREMIKYVGYHVREFVMYSQVVPELNKHWEDKSTNKEVDNRLNIPKFIFGVCNPGEYVLVMENCKILGFVTNDKRNGLDYSQTLLALNHVARLHALSYSFSLSTKFLDKYPCFKFSHALSSLFKPVVFAALENTIKFLKTLPNYEEVVVKLEKGKRAIPGKFQQMWDDQTRHKLLCLTHGDFWNSNLLFRYDPVTRDGERKIEALKLIDWQISQWNNPVFDLHYLLNTSTTWSMRKEHLDDLLHYYHDTFTGILADLNTPAPDWNYDQFYAEFGRTSLVGFMMGLCLIQGTLSKAGEKINQNNSSSNSFVNQYRPIKTVVSKVKTAGAKIIIPVALRPSSQFIIRRFVRKIFEPIFQELIEGQNQILNDRLIDLVKEADEKGLLDVLSM